jgi:phenylacetate-CoA ligase
MASLLARACWSAFTLWHVRKERTLPYRPLEEILALQARRVRAMVGHAYRHVPFYREEMDRRGLKPDEFRMAVDLARLPLIDGPLVADQPQRFRADNLASLEGLGIDSSGTSGRSKKIHYDTRALFLALANGHRQRIVYSHFTGRLFGYRELDLTRPTSVASQIRRFYESYSCTPPWVDLTRCDLSPGDLSFEETVAAINELRPDVIVGYGSYLGVLFRDVHRRKTPIHRPKLIVYGADRMPDADRLLLEQEIGIPVVSIYQSVEALRIGFQCQQRRGFHLSLDVVAVRVVDDQGHDVDSGGAGHIVISNLTNRATVLLNYQLGDVVTLSKAPCTCGRTLPMIEDIRGRSDDVLRLADGRLMHGLVALEPLHSVPGVLQVQIVQQAPDRFLLRAVSQPGANPSDAALALIRALRSKVGDEGEVEVHWVHTIPPGPNGKVKAVVSELAVG